MRVPSPHTQWCFWAASPFSHLSLSLWTQETMMCSNNRKIDPSASWALGQSLFQRFGWIIVQNNQETKRSPFLPPESTLPPFWGTQIPTDANRRPGRAPCLPTLGWKLLEGEVHSLFHLVPFSSLSRGGGKNPKNKLFFWLQMGFFFSLLSPRPPPKRKHSRGLGRGERKTSSHSCCRLSRFRAEDL